MRHKQTLAPSAQSSPIHAKARYILIDSCEYDVIVHINNSSAHLLGYGESIELDGIESFTLENTVGDSNEVSVRYGLGVVSTRGDEQVVEVAKLPAVGIMPGQAVNINKTFNATGMATPTDITIGAGQSKKLVSASNERYELLIQNISGVRVEARVGDSSVSAVRGLVLSGNRTTPAAMSLTHGAEVWAFNNGGTELTLSVMELTQ